MTHMIFCLIHLDLILHEECEDCGIRVYSFHYRHYCFCRTSGTVFSFLPEKLLTTFCPRGRDESSLLRSVSVGEEIPDLRNTCRQGWYSCPHPTSWDNKCKGPFGNNAGTWTTWMIHFTAEKSWWCWNIKFHCLLSRENRQCCDISNDIIYQVIPTFYSWRSRPEDWYSSLTLPASRRPDTCSECTKLWEKEIN